ncbi:hypothetical protein [Streptomyces ginkgonis]|uniref:hypothetical protein n=1 Tax=Streptomyces ginkgonis TaxID=1812259 RepID=UPI002176DE79|nr:hypothetical protein [Streptomyces ginkgonis]
MNDPVALVAAFLRSTPGVPGDAVTGDLVGREAGEVTVYLEHSGGFRLIRNRMDRWDIEYDVYHPEREGAVSLALVCRNALLEDLPGMVVNDALILDVEEVSSPMYLPDSTSREHVYGGEISLFVAAGH